jgi:hypothetical protein
MEQLIGACGFKDEGDRELSQGEGGRLSPSNVCLGGPEFALNPSLNPESHNWTFAIDMDVISAERRWWT